MYWALLCHSHNSIFLKVNHMNIYVGNLPRQASEDDLRPLFEPFGKIMSVNIIKDKFTNESRRFGFVEMAKKSEGQAAIEALNGKEFMGEKMSVNEARPKSESGGRRGGRGGYGGSGRSGRRSY
jgi:RNA recognition motif-containing protein